MRERSTVDRRWHALHITPVGEIALAEQTEIGEANGADQPGAQRRGVSNLLATLNRIYALCFNDDAG